MLFPPPTHLFLFRSKYVNLKQFRLLHLSEKMHFSLVVLLVGRIEPQHWQCYSNNNNNKTVQCRKPFLQVADWTCVLHFCQTVLLRPRLPQHFAAVSLADWCFLHGHDNWKEQTLGMCYYCTLNQQNPIICRLPHTCQNLKYQLVYNFSTGWIRVQKNFHLDSCLRQAVLSSPASDFSCILMVRNNDKKRPYFAGTAYL